jgi:hypothetical protein
MSKKIKVAIIGAGNAACLTALHFYHASLYFDKAKYKFDKISIYYDPSVPIEKVGQGTTLNITKLLYAIFGINIYGSKNIIGATLKNGIIYENWGKFNDVIYHGFPLDSKAVHIVPNKLSQLTLNSGFFDVIQKHINDPESEIDADFIIDCRGKNNRDPDLYEKLINPLNSVILSRKEEYDPHLLDTRCVATPDGWTFVIPNTDSVSYGYLYNNMITTQEQAQNNFTNLFGVTCRDNFQFENYLAKNIFYGERTIFNGNRLSFLEPLEATSMGYYLNVAEIIFQHILDQSDKRKTNEIVRSLMKQIETFVLWHYQFGSKYDTDFWRYAKSLPFKPSNEFLHYLNNSKDNFMNICFYSYHTPPYAQQWPYYSFMVWNQGVGKKHNSMEKYYK